MKFYDRDDMYKNIENKRNKKGNMLKLSGEKKRNINLVSNQIWFLFSHSEAWKTWKSASREQFLLFFIISTWASGAENKAIIFLLA